MKAQETVIDKHIHHITMLLSCHCESEEIQLDNRQHLLLGCTHKIVSTVRKKNLPQVTLTALGLVNAVIK